MHITKVICNSDQTVGGLAISIKHHNEKEIQQERLKAISNKFDMIKDIRPQNFHLSAPSFSLKSEGTPFRKLKHCLDENWAIKTNKYNQQCGGIHKFWGPMSFVKSDV